MGVERAVTLWYIQRHFILNEIAVLDEQLVRLIASVSTDIVDTEASKQAEPEITQQLARARAKLQALGPCPRPMMG